MENMEMKIFKKTVNEFINYEFFESEHNKFYAKHMLGNNTHLLIREQERDLDGVVDKVVFTEKHVIGYEITVFTFIEEIN